MKQFLLTFRTQPFAGHENIAAREMLAVQAEDFADALRIARREAKVRFRGKKCELLICEEIVEGEKGRIAKE